MKQREMERQMSENVRMESVQMGELARERERERERKREIS